MTSSKREERKRRWQERKYHERLGLIIIPIVVVGLIVVYAFALSWATTPSPAFVKGENEFTKVEKQFSGVLKLQAKEIQAQTNAWKESLIVNKEIAVCNAAPYPCVHG